MLSFKLKATPENAKAVFTFAAIMIAMNVIFGPLILLAGVNFILEALTLAEIPYTIGTWFGALLVILTVKSTN